MPDEPPDKPLDVALFITCLTDQFYPRVGVAVTKVLEHFGCRVHFPRAQTCCGQPFFNNGYQEEAAKLARRMVGLFEGYPYIVTPSASCCAMVREQFLRLLGPATEVGGESRRAQRRREREAKRAAEVGRVCARTFEFAEFLDKILKVDLRSLSLPAARKVTYHYTCHSRGIGGIDEAPRMLGQIGNVDFVPLKKTDQCCGFGGMFAVKYPAISGAMVQDKVDCIVAASADTVVCNDAGCTMNIAGMCHRHGVQTRVTHLAELIAEALHLETADW